MTSNPTSKQMSLQQQAMSFLSEGLNNGFWSRTKAQDLVRAMLDANWQQPSQGETSAPSRGSIEYAIEVLKRYRDGSDPDCTCDDCPQCGRLPAECSGTQCAQTCQCSECDHCRVLAAIDGLKGSPQETAAPETCSHPASTRVQAWKCDQCGHLRESFFQDCRHGHAAKNHTCGPECSPVETGREHLHWCAIRIGKGCNCHADEIEKRLAENGRANGGD